jgi:4-hydroxy-tetrahydrodipicolinate synthase
LGGFIEESMRRRRLRRQSAILRGMAAFSGVITAMVTPFDQEGEVDVDAARRLADHLLENGSDGLVVAATTGESPTLDDAEKLSLLEATLDHAGDRAKIMCGTGSNDTRHAAELTRRAADAGAHGALVVVPYYNKPNPAGIKAHFEAVADAAPDLPIVIYNIPSRCVVNADPDLLAELGELDNIVAVKQANNDEIDPIPGLDVLAGNDDVFLPVLERGGPGGILVASHVVGPQMKEIHTAVQEGDLGRAREIDERLRPLYDALFCTANPIPLKAALNMLGLEVGGLRLPLVEADEEQRAIVRGALERQGLLERTAA